MEDDEEVKFDIGNLFPESSKKYKKSKFPHNTRKNAASMSSKPNGTAVNKV